MARGNPLKYNDPTGHCSKTAPDTSEQQAYTEWADCWQMANTILAQWDTTSTYWNNRYTSKDVFREYIAPTPSLDSAYFSSEIIRWVTSDEFADWVGQFPSPTYVDSACHDCDMSGKALVVGVGISADTPVIGGVIGGAPSAAIELVFKDNKVGLFHNVGFGGTAGTGANMSIYVGLVNNLDEINGYSGPFKVANSTASLGPVGVTYGSFRDAVNPNGANGGFIGWAPGANLSYTESRSVTSKPWVVWDRYR